MGFSVGIAMLSDVGRRAAALAPAQEALAIRRELAATAHPHPNRATAKYANRFKPSIIPIRLAHPRPQAPRTSFTRQ
jgi:Tetratricopeptide repeat